jgi:hypothetical protein
MSTVDNAGGIKIDHVTGNMQCNSKKLTGIARGTVSGDAYVYEQTATRYRSQFREDFLNGGTTGAGTLISVVSGTGAAISMAGGDATHLGVIQLASGTTTTGRAGTYAAANAFPIIIGSSGAIEFETVVQIQTLSNGTDTFSLRVGFGDTSGAGDQANGIYFECDSNTDTHWQVCSAASSVRTKQATSVVVGAGTYYRLRFTKPAGSTTFSWEINGTDTGLTTSTNIPTSGTAVFAKLEKSAGTTSRTALVDYFDANFIFDTPRQA